MRPLDLTLRCYAKQAKDNSWYAVCIDLNLVASGDNCQEARKKLHEQIQDYIEDALTVDSEYADQLIPRKAPLYFQIEYYWMKILILISQTSSSTNNCLYSEPLPLRVAQ